jgi:virulence factor Mce-like protein
MTPRRRNLVGRARRPRRTEPRRSVAFCQGLVVVGLLLGLTAIAIQTPNGVPGRSYRTQYAVVPDVGNLQAHNDVRMSGVRVGQVLRASSQDGKARLELQLDGDVGALPTDTAAVVRSAGLLGQRYLELVPGRSQTALAERQTIRAAANSITLGVPEALQTFDAATRGALGRTVDGLGAGLVGRHRDVNTALSVAPTAAREFQTLASAIVADPPAAQRLLPSLDAAAGAVDRSDTAIVRALSPTASALDPFVARRASVRATLSALPPTLEQGRPALDNGRALLDSVRNLVRAVDTTLPGTPTALRQTTALLREAPGPLRRTRSLLMRADTAVPATLKITHALSPVLTPLRKPLDDLVAPVKVLGDHGCDIVNFGKNWRSFLGYGVPGGGKKIGPLGEIRAEAVVTMPFAEAGESLKLPGDLVVRDTYPVPCKFKSTPYSLTDPTK